MKKFVSLILTFVIVLSMAVISASAGNYYENDNHLFEDKFVSQEVERGHSEDYFYDEYYVHTDESGNPDWALVYGYCLAGMPGFYSKEVLGEWVLASDDYGAPFTFRYGVYDVKEDVFVELSQECLDKYDGLNEAMHLLGANLKLIGDVNGDRVLTISDATFIQRVLANLEEFDESDDLTLYCDFGGDLNYVSDMNRKGRRSIADATAIQRKLVGLDVATETE